MTDRENIHAILHYGTPERIPVASFGFWTETLRKWRDEGHVPENLVYDRPMADSEYEEINRMAGFDLNWGAAAGVPKGLLYPAFEPRLVEDLPGGKQKVLDSEGSYVIVKPGCVSIPGNAGHLLTDRDSWRRHYLPRLSYGAEGLDLPALERLRREKDGEDKPLGLFCGSLFGRARNWLGLENFCYLSYDDPDLFAEIIRTVGELSLRLVRIVLSSGIRFDYALFWEDICCNNGPLALPSLLNSLAGPYYGQITGLLLEHGVDIVAVDCDGDIDRLVPVWLKHGVNTMFPMEVGYWEGGIRSWREKYGRSCRGVGGVNKKVFAMDRAAVDREIERIRPLVDLGGYLPCPDHRIPPDAKWDNVRYYCDRFHQVFQ